MPQLNVWYNITLIFIIYYDTVFKILILEYYRKIGILFEYNLLDMDHYVKLLATETLLKNDLECYGLHRNRKISFPTTTNICSWNAKTIFYVGTSCRKIDLWWL